MKLNPKQTELLNFIKKGGKVIQQNNRLWINGEVLNTKTLVSVMNSLYGPNYVEELKKVVVILD